MNCRSDAERAARATYMRDYYRTHPEHAAKRRARAKKYYREKINDPAWRERERQRWRSRHAPRVEHHPERRAAMTDAPVGVDPAFTELSNPALWTLNCPAAGEVAALLADRERLQIFLAHGHRLFRNAVSRKWESARGSPAGTRPDGTEDPSFGQRSNADAQRATLDLYQWLWTFGPTLVLLLDAALLDGAVAKDYRPVGA